MPKLKLANPRKRSIYSEFERFLSLSNVAISQFVGSRKFIKEIREAINFSKGSNELHGFIHNDYRPSNIIFDNDDKVIGVIDFDWSCDGPIVKELALAVVEWSFPDGVNKPDWSIFDVFLEGYNSSANNKIRKSDRLYSWIKLATLSDAATYFCDFADSCPGAKKITSSHMYNKYLFFSKF